MSKTKPYRLFIFTCYGGCATGVAASKACIQIWKENPDDVKIGCLPAVIVPWKFKQILKNSEERILIDACAVKCGKKLFEQQRMPVDSYMELTSTLGVSKLKKLPLKDLERKVYSTIRSRVDELLV